MKKLHEKLLECLFGVPTSITALQYVNKGYSLVVSVTFDFV